MAEFDFVVIGAGSAGCLVASQLCRETNRKVCLVEAGPDYGPVDGGRWPRELLNPQRLPTGHDWGYFEDRPGGFAKPETRAKVIGGCSAHNQCAAIWGVADDYDGWARVGNSGWSYDRLAPLIQRIQKTSAGAETALRGQKGILPTRPYPDDELASWQRNFLESALEAGFPRLKDLSTDSPVEGVAPFHATVKNSMRWNAAFAFLDSVRKRRNLTILSNTLADRLVFREGMAVRLICHARGNIFDLRARKFVVSCGAYGSPMLLMRSGIGPSEPLEKMGIPVQTNLQAVGSNLHDHPGIGIRFELSQSGWRELERDLSKDQQYWNQVILRTRSKQCKAYFDLHILPSQYLVGPGEWVSAIIAFNMTPLSRGRVQLRGSDPYLPPRIDFSFLTDPEGRDIAVLVDGVHEIRRLASLDPIAPSIRREIEPGRPLNQEAELRQYIRGKVTSYAHPVGTCTMGQSTSDSVVDSSGLVHGIGNVWVADASIMPQIPRANTNLTCYLIGLRVALSILETVS